MHKKISWHLHESELARVEIIAKFEDEELYKELCHKDFILKVREIPIKIQ